MNIYSEMILIVKNGQRVKLMRVDELLILSNKLLTYNSVSDII